MTQGIDCGKVILHWVVRAWKVDEANCLVTGYTIDYGIQDVYGTTIGSDEGLDEALLRALLARREAMVLANYETEAHEIRDIDLTLVDAGYRTEAVYDACRQLGLAWKPYMGFGKSQRLREDELQPRLEADARTRSPAITGSCRGSRGGPGSSAATPISGRVSSTIAGSPTRTQRFARTFGTAGDGKRPLRRPEAPPGLFQAHHGRNRGRGGRQGRAEAAFQETRATRTTTWMPATWPTWPPA